MFPVGLSALVPKSPLTGMKGVQPLERFAPRAERSPKASRCRIPKSALVGGAQCAGRWRRVQPFGNAVQAESAGAGEREEQCSDNRERYAKRNCATAILGRPTATD